MSIEQKGLGKGKSASRPFAPTVKKTGIADLVALAKTNNDAAYEDIIMGNVSNFQAQEINAKTGVKINGARKIMSTYGITHVLKGHGNNNEETARGQKGVTDKDFELVPNILSNPDSVSYGGKNSRGKESLIFIKNIDNLNYHVVMSVDVKKGQTDISLATMYIKR